jgi:hypothetical protein
VEQVKHVENENKPNMITSKSMLEGGQVGQVKKVLTGQKSRAGIDVLEHAKMLLVEKGLDVPDLLDKYKKIVETPDVKYRGGDVVKVLELLGRIHGLEQKTAETQADEFVQALQKASIKDIQITLVQITETSKRYLEGLENVQEADIIG